MDKLMICSQCNRIIDFFEEYQHIYGYAVMKDALSYLTYKKYGMCSECYRDMIKEREEDEEREQEMIQVRY